MNQERGHRLFLHEIALEPDIPTYSGGLGVVAGDTVRSGATWRYPWSCVSLLYRKGYFFQKLDQEGRQSEEPVQWTPGDYLEELPERVTVMIEDRPVVRSSWLYRGPGSDRLYRPRIFADHRPS